MPARIPLRDEGTYSSMIRHALIIHEVDLTAITLNNTVPVLSGKSVETTYKNDRLPLKVS